MQKEIDELTICNTNWSNCLIPPIRTRLIVEETILCSEVSSCTPCTKTVHHIMRTHQGITDINQIQFVWCHYLIKPSHERKGSIIARFESFSCRMQVWNKRRNLYSTLFSLSEDFPGNVSRKGDKLRPILNFDQRVCYTSAEFSVDNTNCAISTNMILSTKVWHIIQLNKSTNTVRLLSLEITVPPTSSFALGALQRSRHLARL